MQILKKVLLTIISFSFLSCFSQEVGVWLHPNRGQWDSEIIYKVDLVNGSMNVEHNAFSYVFHDAMQHKHHDSQLMEPHDELVQCHVIRSKFVNSDWNGEKEEQQPSSFYRNYYLGNDQSKWKGKVQSAQEVLLKEFYEGVDLFLSGNSRLKYSFIVKPNVDVSQISYAIEGADSISIDTQGQLHVFHRFGEIIESAPNAWTENGKGKQKVSCHFQVINSVVSFVFPESYDENSTLIIDPNLTFSSFTGATADNWGMTATPDLSGNLYAGGIVFDGSGSYPTTTGAFDVTFNGGNNYTYVNGNLTYSMSGFDVAISKFNASGTAFLYSTYLGGSGNEAPHSLVTDANGNLYVFGVTGSANFPISNGAYDASFNGGPFVSENELGYYGADIFVSRFNAAGSALVGSTFVGGTGTDGINIGNLNYNYGDPFRGEIIVENGFVYVSSTTQSTNFPTVAASQSSLSGGQDAVIFKMNDLLTTMSWSTYFGGSGLETGNSIQRASNGNIYVAGGTNSNTLAFPVGNDLTYNGGISDGYILKLDGTSSAFLAGTFMGMNEYDQAYFVQLDQADDVYVFGQSESAWPITSGLYGTANSGQFIRKYSNNLTSILWTTMVGAGTGHPEISPTAFLVSDCYDIYFSGWGGTINSSYSNQAQFSTTNGFQTTPDAYQSTTNGSNFYLAVLGQNASSLKYATYMGGSSSSYNHVDGGTSRFDKSGRVYHAVCGACGGDNFGFTTTPGVIGPQNLSANCNLAAFKFELSTIEAIISNPEPYICLPSPVVFNNNSSNGNAFYWDFGDGNSSTVVNPSHLYAGPGSYNVTLVVSDTNGCFSADSVHFVVEIGDFEGGVVVPPSPVCPNESYQFEAYGGSQYQWSPAEFLNNATIYNPVATIQETTEFTVIVSDSCGSDTIQVTLFMFDAQLDMSNDTSICIGNSVQLIATGGVDYNWSPATFLDDPSIANPISTPTVTTTYYLEMTTVDDCVLNDSVKISVFYNPPIPILEDTIFICKGATTVVIADGAETYEWSPDYNIDVLTGPIVNVHPEETFTYFCDFKNACGIISDSIVIAVIKPNIQAGNDTIICPHESAQLWASGGVSYNWFPIAYVSPTTGPLVSAFPSQPTHYSVIAEDANGCVDTAYVFVDIHPNPFVQTSPDVYAFMGDEIQLNATSTTTGPFVWSPSEFLSCVVCPNPIATPNQNMTYYVSYVDENGCSARDSVFINFDGILYIPNTFTPDGSQFNEVFKAKGGNIVSFKLQIYNRWGELIYTINDLNESWDGTYGGVVCQDGTYTWKVEYTDINANEVRLIGHVNLLR
jgi:gliding motility-associated-like protein